MNLTCLTDRLRGERQSPLFFWRTSPLAQVVETVVDAVDPKIRAVSRYNKQLRAPVEHAWTYLDSLIDRIPGEMRVSKRRFGIDPRVRVIFDDVGVMLRTFSQSTELTHFFDMHKEAQDSHVILCMEKKERTILGMELEGEMLRRDVLQTAVTFSNHHVMTPAATEQGAKEGIKCCAFEGLLNKAKQLIANAHVKTRTLEESKQRIAAELRQARAEVKRDPSGAVRAMAAVHRLEEKLRTLEQELAEAKMETESPNRHLHVIIDVLSNPQEYLSLRHEVLSVNNLGIKLTGESVKEAHVIEIAEMEIAQSLKRAALVASFPRRDLV